MLVLHRPSATAASQVVLKRVHIWRQVRNLAEHDDQVNIEKDADQVQSSHNYACDEGHINDC